MVGRGGAGKSTLARRLGALTGLPVIELDKHFWQSGLLPLSPDVWARTQLGLVAEPQWIMDGDLGPYDVLDVRLNAADTVIVLDYSFPRCAWRAVRRSREAKDFWLWVWMYRRQYRPQLLHAINAHAHHSTIYRLRTPRAAAKLLGMVAADDQ